MSDSKDVESVYTEQSEYNDQTAFAISNDPTHALSIEDTVPVINCAQTVIASSSVKAPIPSIHIHILSSKFAKPKPIIGFRDTEAQKSA